jgi:hypothetical protein
MALVVADRVRETTTTTGTGTYTLAGAVGGYQSFASAASDADTVYYAVTNDTDWEIGIGTLGGSGTTLARTTILQSSNSDSAVSWGAAAKQIFLTYPAERAVYMNGDGTTSDFFDAAGSSTPRTSSTGSAVVPLAPKPSAMDHPALAICALTPMQHPLRATMVQLGVRLAVAQQVMPSTKTLQLLRKI